MKQILGILISSIALLAVASVTVAAQSQPAPQQGNGQALEIAPPVLDIRGNPGEIVEARISLRDISPVRLLVRNEINDFVAAGEDGTPKILVEEGEESPYSIKSWISPLPEITLEPRQIEELTVNIAIPANAAPGGYFGVIRFTAEAPELSGTGVSLSASLGTLVLLRVNGDAKEAMSVEEFYVEKDQNRSWVFESAPIMFYERLKNEGNVHEQPRGQISIKDMFGQKIANLNVNLENRNVLPGSTRKFEQPLDETVIGNRMLFGRYTADLEITYGSAENRQIMTSQLSFWVIPYKLIAGILLGLVALFFILRIAIKRYNDRLLSQSRGRRRR